MHGDVAAHFMEAGGGEETALRHAPEGTGDALYRVNHANVPENVPVCLGGSKPISSAS